MKLRIYIAGLFTIIAAFFIIILCACIVDIKAESVSDSISENNTVATDQSEDAIISGNSALDDISSSEVLDQKEIINLQTNYNSLVTRYNDIVSKCKGTAIYEDSTVKDILTSSAEIISEIGDTDLNKANDSDITDIMESIELMNEVLNQLSNNLNIELDSENSVQSITANYELPDFTVTTTSGDSFTLSEQGGNVVVLSFFTTWCGPCELEMPILQKIHDTYSDSGVKVLSLCCGESTKAASDYMTNHGLSYMAAGDSNGSISEDYEVYSIPYTIVFNKDGSVAATFDGLYTEGDYVNAIEDAINK